MASKGDPKVRGKGKEQGGPGKFSALCWSIWNKTFYLAAAAFVGAYVAFLYDPVAFSEYAERHETAKPLVSVFNAIDTYSPFHEFISDAESRRGADSKVARSEGKEIFTKDRLSEYSGAVEGKGPYLAVLGQVFDVSKKAETYGPGGGYGFFSGKDGSRAFVSGEFNDEGLVDDVTGLSHQDYLGLEEWVQFYHKDYTYVGKVVGRFYDEGGRETEYKKEVDGWIRAAQADKEKKSAENQMFPGCNSEWGKKKGHRVWCTNKSGGVKRSWVGRPRRVFLPGRSERCACVKDSGPPSTDASAGTDVGDLDNPHLKEYEGCDPKASSCQLKPPEPDDEDN